MADFSDGTIGGTGLAYIETTDIYIENPAGSASSDSSNLVDGTETGILEFNSTTGTLTGTDYTHVMHLPIQINAASSPRLLLRNARWHWTFETTAGTQGVTVGDSPSCLCALDWENVDIFSTAKDTTTLSWGIFNNGTGTNLPVFDSEGHIDTQGDGGRARTRPINWTNVRIFGDGGLRVLINGADPRTSTFTNVNFFPDNTADTPRGAFAELPYVPFAGASFGFPFFRDNLFMGFNLWMRQTGGPLRRGLNIPGTAGITEPNWLIHAQHDLTGLAGDSTVAANIRSMAIDGGVWVMLVNPRYAADVSNLRAVGGQDATTLKQSRFTSATAWNPRTNAGDIRYDIRATGSTTTFTVPTVYNGGNVDGTQTVPGELTGDIAMQPDNGFFFSENNGQFTAPAADGAGVPSGEDLTLTALVERTIPIYSYTHQVNTFAAAASPTNFGEGVLTQAVGTPATVPALGTDINSALEFASIDNFEFMEDPFLAGRTVAESTEQVESAAHFWPTWKGILYADPVAHSGEFDNRLRMIPGETSVRFFSSVNFRGTASSPSGATTFMNIGGDLDTSVVNDFTFIAEDPTSNVQIFWNPTQEFTTHVTISGGTHLTFPTNLANGFTVGPGNFTVERSTTIADVAYDWTNTVIPDGTNVFIGGGEAITIRGLSTAEQARVLNLSDSSQAGPADGVTFLPALLDNIITVPAPANGRVYIERARDGLVVVDTTDPESTIVAGTQLQVTISSGDGWVNTDIANIYVKYDSTVGGTFYQEQLHQVVYEAINGTEHTFSPVSVSPVLVAGAAATTGVALELQLRTIGGTANTPTFAIRNTANTDRLSIGLNTTAGQQLGLAALLANQDDYFNQWVANRVALSTTTGGFTVTAPMLSYIQGDNVLIDNTYLTFGSGNEADGSSANAAFTGTRLQHTVYSWRLVAADESPTLFSAGVAFPEIARLETTFLVIDPAQIRIGIDDSTMAGNVIEILEDTSTTLQGDVTAILEDTGTTIPDSIGARPLGTGTVFSGLAAIEADTGTAIPDTIAAVKADTAAILVDTGTTLQDELDGIQTSIGAVTDAPASDGSLFALNRQVEADVLANTGNIAAVNNAVTTIDGIVDSILEDTATTIPGTITTLQDNVTDILEDTETTIPLSITTLAGDVATVDGIVNTITANVTTLGNNIGTPAAGVTVFTELTALDGDTDRIEAATGDIDTVVDTISTRVDELQQNETTKPGPLAGRGPLSGATPPRT